MTCNVGTAGFDVATAAGWYSAIAGLLAGFALLSVLFPLDHEIPDDDEDARSSSGSSVVVFTCAFFALLILAFTYAILSGRTGEDGRSAIAVHEQQLNGAAFGLSSLLMLLGLHAVLRIYGSNRRMFGPARSLIMRVTALYGPIIVIGFQFSNALDIEAYRAQRTADGTVVCQFGALPGVWVNAVISLVAVAALVVLAVLNRRTRVTPGAVSLIARATLGFTIAVAVWSSLIVPFLPADLLTSSGMEYGVHVVSALAAVAFGAAVWRSR